MQNRRAHLRACLIVATALASSACPPAGPTDGGDACPEPPVLKGAYTGTVVCPNSQHKIDLGLYQEDDDNDVDGTLFVEWNVRYQDGLFDATQPHVVRGDIVDGELTGDSFTGLSLTETVAAIASAPDFSFELEVVTDNLLQGTLSQLNASQEAVVTCDAYLSRVGSPPPELPDPAAGDAGA